MNPEQFERLDSVVRNTTEGLKVDSVTIFDSEVNIISYSTIPELIGIKNAGKTEYENAVEGRQNSFTIESNVSFRQFFLAPKTIYTKLTAYIPLVREEQFKQTEDVMGITQVTIDISKGHRGIVKFQAIVFWLIFVLIASLALIKIYITNSTFLLVINETDSPY